MNKILNILPKEANNNYQGSKIAIYGSILFTALMLFRSYMHLFEAEYAANFIAHFIVFEETQPNPNSLVYLLFGLWGLEQMILTLFSSIVLIQYRNLIPLHLTLWIIEWTFRPIVVANLYPLSEEFFTGSTPGKIGTPYVIVFLILMLVLSLKKKR
ncbi:MAG: hypothetical protein HOH08_03835 [Gammaproteobacteria bacterium]|jgi:hypothetical protein|nr:hypothetical protein [Gammaproteobacteria bacterium]MBT5216773.1 hypothetical protein [Gammaproteobacteria bacterium]MBT5542268.1 hypothetical protein [Gammaproteobacteria bacterium]MBT6074064.1 hypothetical protein [Gammaproteobacteria bacterium]MBT7753795.1 hypothetical protein [Gammaproteobacteria bacterium]